MKLFRTTLLYLWAMADSMRLEPRDRRIDLSVNYENEQTDLGCLLRPTYDVVRQAEPAGCVHGYSGRRSIYSAMAGVWRCIRM